MPFLRKYATATHVYIPIIKRAVVDYAVGADWTPATGDVKVSIDGGAAANIGTLPTAIAMGNTAYWDFTIATGEVTGKKIVVTVADSATKAVEDQTFLIETYGHASAEYPTDWSADQTPLKPTTAGRTLDVSAGGEAGVDLANVGSSTTTLNLSGLTIKTATDLASAIDAVDNFIDTEIADIQARLPAALVSGRMDSSLGAVQSGVDFSATQKASINTEVDSALDTAIPGSPTANSVNERLQTLDNAYTATRAAYLDNVNNSNLANVPAFPSNFASLGINASGHISRVTLADTVTTNTDMITAAQIRAAVGLASANLDTQLSAIAGYLDTEIAAILTAVDTEIAAVLTAVGTTLPAQISALLTTAGTESYRSDGAAGSVFQLLYEIMALSGEFEISGTTKQHKKIDGSTNAFASTLDSSTAPTSISRAA